MIADEDSLFEVGPADYLRRKYKLDRHHRPSLSLNKENVPEDLWPLIPLAERWGVSDSLTRTDIVDHACPDDLRLLKEAVRQFGPQLNSWLAGPEAAGPEFSEEYIAFSAMRMLVDCL
jgi:hypothetical protein